MVQRDEYGLVSPQNSCRKFLATFFLYTLRSRRGFPKFEQILQPTSYQLYLVTTCTPGKMQQCWKSNSGSCMSIHSINPCNHCTKLFANLKFIESGCSSIHCFKQSRNSRVAFRGSVKEKVPLILNISFNMASLARLEENKFFLPVTYRVE